MAPKQGHQCARADLQDIAAILISFKRHEEWISREQPRRPASGSLFLFDKLKVKFRKDGWEWEKRTDGKTTREDHAKLKVEGVMCIYGCYAHSAEITTFHRRCYWLLRNPRIVLVHYLNTENSLPRPTTLSAKKQSSRSAEPGTPPINAPSIGKGGPSDTPAYAMGTLALSAGSTLTHTLAGMHADSSEIASWSAEPVRPGHPDHHPLATFIDRFI
eukprot:m.164780 g.164780  ORF g.164780 m.164780 type:complete len:216 (-) comp9888_c1_seq1:196-843(-)